MHGNVPGGLTGQLAGGDLSLPDDLPGTLADTLATLVHRRPGGRYIEIHQNGTRTEAAFGDLFDHAHEILAHCRKAGLSPGAEIVLGYDRFTDFVPAAWAAILGQFWCVPWHLSAAELAGAGLPERLSLLGETFRKPLILAPGRITERLRAAAAETAVDIAILDEPARGDRQIRAARAAGEPGGAKVDGGFLVATSGTTGTPKFARIEARVLLNRFFARYGRRRTSSRLLAFPFDGVTGLSMALPTDDVEIYLDPQRMMALPREFLTLLEQYRIRSIGLSSSMLEKMVEALEAAPEAFDLSALGHIGLGGEMVVPQLVSRLIEGLSRAGAGRATINFGYGSSEMGTICATRFTHAGEALAAIGDGHGPVSVGGCLESCSLRIVDGDDLPLPEGETGNIQVRSDMKMFSGYAGRDGDDIGRFVDGWFRTGDAGFIDRGELRITGREDSKIIVHGRNISLERIEAHLRQLEDLPVSTLVAAAMRMPGGATEELAVFFIPAARDADALDRICRRLRRATARLAGIGIRHLVPVEEHDISRTASQKIRRQPLVEAFLAGRLRAHVPAQPSSEIVEKGRFNTADMPADPEAWLGELWRRVLGLDTAPRRDDDFFELGGDSLASAEMIFAVEGKFGIGLPLESYFRDPTLARLIALVAEADPAQPAAAPPAGTLSRSAILRDLETFHRSWAGTRAFPGSLIAGHNVSGTRMPLFWVFQNNHEATQLAKRLHPEQPLYAMRSLVRIQPVRNSTAEVLDIVCDRYLWEILAIAGNRPIALGGNCQAAIIALALARRLRQIGHTPKVLVLMEWAYSLGPYEDFTCFLYSRDGHTADIFRNPDETSVDWRQDFPNRKVSEITGAHGEIFFDEHVDALARPLTDLLRDVAADRPFGGARLLLQDAGAALRRSGRRIGREYKRFRRRRLSFLDGGR